MSKPGGRNARPCFFGFQGISVRNVLKRLGDLTQYFHFLNRVWTYLRGRSSLAFGASYLALIPMYAIVYTFFSDEFIHSNLSYEGRLDELTSALEREVLEQYAARVKSINLSQKRPSEDNIVDLLALWEQVRTPTEFSLLQMDKDGAHFSMSFEESEASLGAPEFFTERFYFRVPFVKLLETEGEKKNAFIGYFPTVTHSDLSNKYLLDAFGRSVLADGKSHHVFVSMSSEAVDEIQRIGRGVVKGGVENFHRYFYFSAVTITTLGYGDIAPITVRSRLLVASETIFGIVLIGLFLNSLKSPRSRDV